MNRPTAQPTPTGSGSTTRLVDLSHVVRHGMTTYPGLPGPRIEDHLSREESRTHYAPGTEFQIGRMTLVANTGTYLDAPFHRFADGADLSQVPLSRLVDVPGVIVDVYGAPAPGIGADVFTGCAITGRAVLIRTGWDRHWGTPAYGAAGHPFLTAEAASWLASQNPAVTRTHHQPGHGTHPFETCLVRSRWAEVPRVFGGACTPVAHRRATRRKWSA